MAKWYCIQTKAKSEQTAADYLRDQYYNIYDPVVYSDKRMSKKRANEPMFPGYIFANLTLGEDPLAPIKHTKGVLKLIQFGDYLPSLPDNWIESLKAREDEDYVIHIYKDYEEGDLIRIKSGAFEGYEGVFQKNGNRRVFVMLNELQKGIQIPKTDIEPIVA